MSNLMKIFNKQGGVTLLKQYIKSGIFLSVVAQFLLLGKSKKALEILRVTAKYKFKNKLSKKYKNFIVEYKNNLDLNKLEHKHSNKIWFCWFQGVENAPELVQKCYASLKENIKDKEIVVISDENYKEYVQFPEYIQEKIDKGIISKTHMSDLLRLELLIRYGGSWVDATVFCSGKNIPEYMLNSDLFLFQKLKPGLDGHCTSISSWFITACSNQTILLLTRALLYDYWNKYNYMKEYFLLHFFFQLAIEAYPDEWKKVMPFCNSIPHILLLRLFDEYKEDVWNEVTRVSPFHKLTYKLDNIYKDETDLGKENTYYKRLF